MFGSAYKTPKPSSHNELFQEMQFIKLKLKEIRDKTLRLNPKTLNLYNSPEWFFRDAESMIVSLAMEAAKKIVGKQLEIEPSTLIDMIGNSIRPVASHKNITIYVSKKDFSIIYKHKKQVADYFEKLESFAIQEKVDLEPTSCVIETESGIINVHLPTMWAALENAFKKLVENIDIADSSHTQEESS